MEKSRIFISEQIWNRSVLVEKKVLALWKCDLGAKMMQLLFFLCIAFVSVTPNPLLQRYQQQCPCPVNNYPQNQLQNVPLELSHQHTTPQLVSQAYNALVQSPHQCIPVRDQGNQQFLNKVLENPLIKALQEQNQQQYQNTAQNPGQHPHIVNNYFIIPTEALLSEEDDNTKKDKGNHAKKEARNNKVLTNHGTNGVRMRKQNNGETHAFLDEYFNQNPQNKNHLPENSHIVQTKKTTELQKCSENEQPIEVELEPTFARIKEYHEPEAAKVPTYDDAEEAVIQDMRNKFPNMPEPLIRSLVSAIRPRFQRFNPYQNHRQPYRPRAIQCAPGNSTMDETGNHWHHRHHRRPLRRNANRKRKGSNRNITLASDVDGTMKKIETLDLKEASKVKPTITEFHRNVEATIENYKHTESNDMNKSNEIENTTPYVIYPSHMNIELPELGSEDIIPNVDNCINDDYYPDFTKDNKVHSMHNAFYNYPEFYEEVLRSEKRIGDDRETHRSKVLDGKKTPKKVMRKLHERQNKGKYINEKRHDDKSDEIVYKIPPGLENPDFTTVNVREYYTSDHQRPTYFSREFEHSADKNDRTSENEVKSTNNEPVITYYLPSKSADAGRKRPTERLETVFANSKIVNYGCSPEVFDGETTTVFSIDLGTEETKNTFVGDAVVTARSNVDSEEFNW